MKNDKAQFIEDVTYEIVMTDGGAVSTQKVTLQRAFFNNLGEGEDWEFIYAMEDEFEAILKLKHGESMPFQPCRSSEEWGLILRIK